MDQEWLTFEQAGELIDGPDGWRLDESGNRQSAQSLLMFAHKGHIATTARVWACAINSSEVGKNRPADARERSDFLLMLCARERSQSDNWNLEVTPTMSIHAAFSVADDLAGNFEAFRIKRDPGHGTAQNWTVVGLRFSKSDVKTLFGCAEKVGNDRKAGRPKNSGGFRAQDLPIIEQMRTMIEATPGMSAFGAAQHFISQAAGNAGDERKRKRLSELYLKTYHD